jgi:hypothetical protein
MRRRRDKHAEDQVREKMIPAADADPVATTNGSVSGHPLAAEPECSGLWDPSVGAWPRHAAVQPPPVLAVAPPPPRACCRHPVPCP